MRVAIVSDYGLPDARIERMISTFLNREYEIHFIGNVRGFTGIINPEKINFIEIKWNKYTSLGIEPYYSWIKRKIMRILKRVRPDIIIAVNVYSGRLIYELGYPLILDSREVLDLRAFYGLPYRRNLIDRIIHMMILKRIVESEYLIFEKHPVLAISDLAAKHYKYGMGASKVYIVKNYPLRSEGVCALFNHPSRNEILMTYIGKEFTSGVNHHTFHRRMDTTWKVLQRTLHSYDFVRLLVIGDDKLKTQGNIVSLGYIKHMSIYRHLARVHYGILTLEPHIFHKYTNLLRAYMYAHAGVIPVITSTLEDVLKDLNKHSIVVEAENFKYNLELTLKKIIEEFDYEEHLLRRYKLINYARNSLTWENQEKTLINAIKHA